MQMLDAECRKQTAAFMEDFRRQMAKAPDADSELSQLEKRLADRTAERERQVELAEREAFALRKGLADVRAGRMIDHEVLKEENACSHL